MATLKRKLQASLLDQDQDSDIVGGHGKRIRADVAELDRYSDGALVKVRVENFVTYSLAEFVMSPSMNMIIGPNGSGKSSLVCAICLGLAGKPEYIKRAKKIEEFIKNGKDQGKVEITLKRDAQLGGDYVCPDQTTKITRILTRNSRRSEYLINDRVASESMVKELVATLNVQLDNVCQFLPQERVEEFAKLSSDKLLIETLRSVDIELVRQFKELQELQKTKFEQQEEFTVSTERMQVLAAEKKKLEVSVRAIEGFRQKKAELDLNKKLLPYVKVKDHKQKIKEYKKAYDEVRAQLRELLQDKRPFDDLISKIHEEALKKQEKEQKMVEKLKKTDSGFTEIRRLLFNIKETAASKKVELQHLKDLPQRIAKQIEDKQKQLDEQRQMLAEFDGFDRNAIDKYENDLQTIVGSQKECEIKKQALERSVGMHRGALFTLEKEMNVKRRQLNSSDRLAVLDPSNPRLRSLREAIIAIRADPSLKNRILEPPLMSVSTSDQQMASFLSVCVDFNTSIALTFLDNEAYDLVNDKYVERYSLNLRQLASNATEHPLPISQIKEWGFDGYLSEFLKGDENVVKMLCQQQRLHQIPVSRKPLSDQVLQLLRRPDKSGRLPFNRVLAHDTIYTFSRSKYGNRQVLVVSRGVPGTKFYQGMTVSQERKATIERDIKQLTVKIDQKNTQIQESRHEAEKIEADEKEINYQKKSLDKRLAQNKSNLRRIGTIESRIKELASEMKKLRSRSKEDTSTQVAERENEMRNLINAQIGNVAKMVNRIKVFQDPIELRDYAAISSIELINKENSMKDVFEFLKGKEDQLREVYQEHKDRYIATKETAEYQEWMTAIKGYNRDEKAEISRLAEKYSENGTFTLECVTREMVKLESEIAMFNQDESVLEQLQRKEKEFEKLAETVPRMETALLATQDTIRQVLQHVRPRVDLLVENLSKKFALLFRKVGSAGEVRLDTSDPLCNWKLEIMVKFRDSAPLKRLDSRSQSGGERAVSTVLFMIALQEFTSSPFRVVDEINQGMDAHNERRIHKAMMENACADKMSQYILVTPKLLPNLPYHEKMRIHCVMAGPWLPLSTDDTMLLGRTDKYF
ncbi:LAMI_0F07074g1_1 [Lachancea mirantina]|uniref:Structural maintenance of chromosomes protein 5 n=1 Tax=Lachancea mirantina TaxID=1230905 RepID=A0A1G4JZE7_9SACH|nr:LAMI_0F07074g1_1 [Lachancea mirantina]